MLPGLFLANWGEDFQTVAGGQLRSLPASALQTTPSHGAERLHGRVFRHLLLVAPRPASDLARQVWHDPGDLHAGQLQVECVKSVRRRGKKGWSPLISSSYNGVARNKSRDEARTGNHRQPFALHLFFWLVIFAEGSFLVAGCGR